MSLQNQLKTVLLLGGLTGLLLLIGTVIGGKAGLTIALIFAGGMNFFSYWFSDKIAIFMYKGVEADRTKESELYHILEELSSRAKILTPRLFIIPSSASNAFASGPNQKKAVVAVTTGLLKLLTKDELKGVLAHELGHIKNKDILISSIAATIAGVISYIAMMARWAAIFGGFGGNNENGSNILELLALAIIAPVVAMIIQFAISRSREFLADEAGAKIAGSPYGLASALEKLEQNVKTHPFQKNGTTQATAHLFINNPFNSKNFFELFSTHPSSEARCKKLRAMRF